MSLDISSVGTPSLRAAVGRAGFVGTIFVFVALRIAGLSNGAEGPGRAVEVLGAAGIGCCAVNSFGGGGAELSGVAFGLAFKIGGACPDAPGVGVVGRVARGIGGAANFEGPATGWGGGIAEVPLSRSFSFFKKTASALRCLFTHFSSSMFPAFTPNLYALQHSHKNRGASNSAFKASSFLALKIFVLYFLANVLLMMTDTHQLGIKFLNDSDKIAVVRGALKGTIGVVDGLMESFPCGEWHCLYLFLISVALIESQCRRLGMVGTCNNWI